MRLQSVLQAEESGGDSIVSLPRTSRGITQYYLLHS